MEWVVKFWPSCGILEGTYFSYGFHRLSRGERLDDNMNDYNITISAIYFENLLVIFLNIFNKTIYSRMGYCLCSEGWHFYFETSNLIDQEKN